MERDLNEFATVAIDSANDSSAANTARPLNTNANGNPLGHDLNCSLHNSLHRSLHPMISGEHSKAALEAAHAWIRDWQQTELGWVEEPFEDAFEEIEEMLEGVDGNPHDADLLTADLLTVSSQTGQLSVESQPFEKHPHLAHALQTGNIITFCRRSNLPPLSNPVHPTSPITNTINSVKSMENHPLRQSNPEKSPLPVSPPPPPYPETSLQLTEAPLQIKSEAVLQINPEAVLQINDDPLQIKKPRLKKNIHVICVPFSVSGKGAHPW